MNNLSKYYNRGVSFDKKEVHEAIKNVDKGLYPKAFCKIVPDIISGDDEYCIVMHADGAGTKSSLAYAYWKETGDITVWKGIAQDSLIMNIDDLICVGAVDNIIVSSTIGRNKKLIPGDVLKAVIEGNESIISKLNSFGINIKSSGGETADVGDLVRTIIVDSTVTARIKRSDVIDNHCQGPPILWGQILPCTFQCQTAIVRTFVRLRTSDVGYVCAVCGSNKETNLKIWLLSLVFKFGLNCVHMAW